MRETQLLSVYIRNANNEQIVPHCAILSKVSNSHILHTEKNQAHRSILVYELLFELIVNESLFNNLSMIGSHTRTQVRTHIHTRTKSLTASKTIVLILVEICFYQRRCRWSSNTVHSRYLAVPFLQITHKRHPINRDISRDWSTGTSTYTMVAAFVHT